jgi:hypothetical protein
MRKLIMVFCLSFMYKQTYSQVKLVFEEFNVEFYPSKCKDTLKFAIQKGIYEGDTLKLFLNSCKGEGYIQVYSKKNKVKIQGYYADGIDTLKRYNNAKIMGKPKGEHWYQVRVLRYFSPLPCKSWIFFDEKSKRIREIKYQYISGGNG